MKQYTFMGLFDFFKKKPAPAPLPATPSPEEMHQRLINVLAERLTALGFRATQHTQHLSLIVNEKVEIAPLIIPDANLHPTIMQVMFLTMHQELFPDGIEEHIPGLGTSLQQQMESAVENYLFAIFEPISRSLAGTQHAHKQLMANDNTTVWHVTLGNIALQGKWNTAPTQTFLFEQLQSLLPAQMQDQPVNWLKLYVSKSAEGNIMAECVLNNKEWAKGHELLTHYAESWYINGNFHGLKQFMVFRKG